jgi:hypothetical protein
MRRSIFALAGVAVLAAVTALVFGTVGGAAIPMPESFTFCSGNLQGEFGPNNEGPSTSIPGAVGDPDQSTLYWDLSNPSFPVAVWSVVIAREPDWGLIEDSRWISFDDSRHGPDMSGLVTFFVRFFVPTGARYLTLAVATLQADWVEISLNDATQKIHSGSTQEDKKTYNATPVTGWNELSFDLYGPSPYGLDYCATVTYRLGLVGGIVDLPADTGSPADASASARDYTAPIAAAAVAAAIALVVGGWFARRRWLR